MTLHQNTYTVQNVNRTDSGLSCDFDEKDFIYMVFDIAEFQSLILSYNINVPDINTNFVFRSEDKVTFSKAIERMCNSTMLSKMQIFIKPVDYVKFESRMRLLNSLFTSSYINNKNTSDVGNKITSYSLPCNIKNDDRTYTVDVCIVV